MNIVVLKLHGDNEMASALIRLVFSLTLIIAVPLRTSADMLTTPADQYLNDISLPDAFWEEIWDNYTEDNLNRQRLQCTGCFGLTNCTTCREYVQNCRCDKFCHNFNDCCEDSDPPAEGVFVYQPELGTYGCYELNVDGYRSKSFMVIDSCPSSSGWQISAECSQSSLFPVVGDETKLLFSNAYCASCHGELSYTMLPPGLYCDFEPRETVSSILKALIEDGYYWDVWISDDNVTVGGICKLFYNLTYEDDQHDLMTAPVSECGQHGDLLYAVSSCLPRSDRNEVIRCTESPASVVYTNQSIYRNKFCARCNNNSSESQPSCTPPERDDPTIIGFYPGHKPDVASDLGPLPVRTFSSLIQLSMIQCVQDQSFMQGLDCENNLCRDGTLYQPFIGCSEVRAQHNYGHDCLSWKNSTAYELNADGTASIETINGTVADYSMLNGTLVYCSDNLVFSASKTLPPSDDQNITSKVSTIISIVLVFLSIIALMAQFMVSLLIKGLQTEGWVIRNCLVVSLMVALLFYLISLFVEHTHVVCVVVAVLQHYAFIASFCWMCVIGFDITCLVLHPFNHVSKCWKIAYHFFAWVTPLVFVGCAVCSEFLLWSVIPKYAYPHCWINSAKGLLVYFVTPIATIIMANIFMFVISICKLKSEDRRLEQATNQNRSRLLFMVRMLVILGLPWIFSMFTILTPHRVVSLIASVLNASQGLLIALSYFLAANVREKLVICQRKNLLISTVSSELQDYATPVHTPL